MSLRQVSKTGRRADELYAAPSRPNQQDIHVCLGVPLGMWWVAQGQTCCKSLEESNMSKHRQLPSTQMVEGSCSQIKKSVIVKLQTLKYKILIEYDAFL